MELVLAKIGKALNDACVLWGVGASLMLKSYGLADAPKDIDIIVSIEDVEKTDTILQSLGERKTWEKAATYSTKYFYEYVIDGIDIDVISGMRINFDGGCFEYPFDALSIVQHLNICGEDIPMTSLEDWYVLYQIIPDRMTKVAIIETYLKTNGIKYRNILERSLEGTLPKEVRSHIRGLLKL
jgi:hypothetical protein